MLVGIVLGLSACKRQPPAAFIYPPTPTETPLPTATPIYRIIDNFTDLDLVSLNGPPWVAELDSGGVSTFSTFANPSGSVTIFGNLSNNELSSWGEYWGWGQIGVGSLSDPLEGITYTSFPYINFKLRATNLAPPNTEYVLTIEFDNGDAFHVRLNSCSIEVQQTFSFDMASFYPIDSNSFASVLLEPGNVIGLSVRAFITNAFSDGPGFLTGAFGFSLDDVEFSTSALYALKPAGLFVDDFEDGDLESRELCNAWISATDTCLSTILVSNVADAPGAGGLKNLNVTGDLEACEGAGGYIGWMNIIQGFQSGRIITPMYQNIRFWAKGTLAGLTTSGLRLDVWTEDGDIYEVDISSSIGPTWALANFDLTLSSAQAGNPVHSDFASENTKITNIVLVLWGWSATQFDTGAYDLSFDEIEFY